MHAVKPNDRGFRLGLPCGLELARLNHGLLGPRAKRVIGGLHAIHEAAPAWPSEPQTAVGQAKITQVEVTIECRGIGVQRLLAGVRHAVAVGVVQRRLPKRTEPRRLPVVVEAVAGGVIVVGLAVLLLGDPLTPWLIAGGALVIIGARLVK